KFPNCSFVMRSSTPPVFVIAPSTTCQPAGTASLSKPRQAAIDVPSNSGRQAIDLGLIDPTPPTTTRRDPHAATVIAAAIISTARVPRSTDSHQIAHPDRYCLVRY